MEHSRPYILSIAGLDPSAGAGLLADIKTFENLSTYGLSVCTAITVQNDISFEKCQWTTPALIFDQLDILFSRFTIPVVKIGIVENWEVLNQIIDYLMTKNSTTKIIWDPILKSSTDYTFQNQTSLSSFESIIRNCYLITPNYPEIQQLTRGNSTAKKIQLLQQHCSILLKGGHHPIHKGTDFLYQHQGNIIEYPSTAISSFEKHGSGCVLSSSIAAFLALGNPLEEACKMAKEYTFTFLESTNHLLGYHTS